MNEAAAVRKAPPQAQSSGSIHSLMTSRQPYMSEPIASKRVCFYKSGDAQFSGLPVVINNRTFKTFEALLDSLSKRVPLPFGVRTITTPRGHTTVRSLDQLHHGHSYICSDKRTVKPIDLERARRKPPPWYHARPVSSRRLARQRQSPGPRSTRRARRNEHAALLHTPKRLVAFRNGDPEVKHTLLLQKRTTHSFEALLDLVSEVMHFPVLKLYTPDGRRVDGLPALILCSGVLVAAGREPFRKGNYDVQKPSAPTWLPAKSVGRLHPVSRKKKSMTSSTKSRPFSPSSERYIVNQIHNSFAGSACDYPSNPTGSVEMETGQLPESIAETDTIACLDGEGEGDIHMPTEDDIEKSFRINQDGSMTVEMKVRLTIKEEETIHWTTTLSRSSVASQMKTASKSHSDLGATISDNIPPEVDPVASEVIENCPEELAFLKESPEEMEAGRAEPIIREKEPLHSLPSSPGWRKVQQKQSVGSTMKVTETEIQENVMGSYAYKEETSNGEMKQEHCMVRQCRSRPVPKPRSNLPSELNATTSQLQSNTYKSAEILQLQDNGEAVHETVLHIYEQQTCQENFFANTQLCVQGMATYSSAGGRPASSDTVFPASSEKTMRSSSEDLESEPRVSSTYGSLMRQKNVFQSDLYTLHQKNIPQEIRSKKSTTSSPVTEFSKPSEPRIISTADTSKRRKPVRVIVKKNHIFQIAAPERKQKDDKMDTLKEIKKIRADIFSRAGTTRRTEHYRAKAVQKLLKRRNNQANRQVLLPSSSTPSMIHNPVQLMIQSPNELPPEKEQFTNEVSPVQPDISYRKLNDSSASPKRNLLHAATSKCTLTRQTSMNEERDFQRETRELSESISLPALHSSSSVFNEYVNLWLQKSEPDQEQVPSTHTELQENTTFLTPQESQPSPEVGEIICETMSARETLKEDLPCCVPVDNTSSPRNLSSAKSSMEEKFSCVKEILYSNSPPERISLPKDSSEGNTSLSKRNTFEKNISTEVKSPQNNTVEKIPLPRNLSLKKNTWKKSISSEESSSLKDKSSEKKIIQNVSQGETPLARNASGKTSQATSDNDSASSESSIESSKLSSNQEIMPVPRHLRMSLQSKDSGSEMNIDKTSTGNDHVKETLISCSPSSEKTLLPNRCSVEKIPKNNTLIKASLFNNQNMEKTLSTQVTSDKKPRLRPSSLSESKRTLLGKSQVTSDATKSIILRGDITRSETTKCTSLRAQSDADAQITPPTEMSFLQAEKSYSVKMAVRPDMRQVLEELCHSIQSLREVTQHKRRSCLEKSNSMPDFSSHLASTFGSSSRVLLAFLSVMTLKDGLANMNACRQAQDILSCSEALLMLQSLKEMATIEDAEKLRASLNALQNSTSVQLLQSWRGFQELSNTSRSHSVTSGSSRSGSYSGSCSEEEAIQGLMEDLGVPDRVREELAALCTQEEESIRGNHGLEKQSESLPEVKMNGLIESFLREKTISLPDSVLEDVNIYVKSVIEKAVKAHLDDCGTSDVSVTHLLVSAEKETKVATDKHAGEFSQIKRTKQADCVLDFNIDKNMSSHESALEEKQKTTEERVAELIRTEDRGVVAEQQEINAKPQKEKEVIEKRAVFEDCDAKTNDTMEEALDSDEGRESAKKLVDTREIDEDGDTEKSLKSSESPTSSENKLTTSEEEKSSLEEEEDSCDEELMSFSEDQVSDKEENLGSDQNYAMTATLSQWQNEGQASQTQSQLHSKTESEETLLRPPEMQTTLLTIHIESDVKEDMTRPETEQQHAVYEERMIYPGEEQMILEAPECYTIYKEHCVEEKEYGPEKAEEHEEKTAHFTEKKKTSVAELISNIESVAQRASDIPKKPVDRFLTHIDIPDISDTDKIDNVSQMSSEQDGVEEFIKDPSKVQTQDKSDSEKHLPNELSKKIRTTKQSHMDLTSEPLSSSLAFSYDSRSSSLAQEPEESIQVNRVKSIREMFLAKSDTTTRKGPRRQHRPHSDMSDYQAESSDSGGNQSQTSPETSSGEDDTSRLAIAKGFVRRTIERLYGRGHSNSTGPDDRRPLSASRGKQREGPGRTNVTTLASIHETRTQGKTDLSYFNATSSVDAFNESTHCVTLNAQVGPEDAVLIDKGCWLLRENQLIRESSPELESPRREEKNTTILVDSEQDAMKEDVPYSLFCPASPNRTLSSTELEELPGSLGPKFTYFNLPNASDSELEPEGRNSDTPPKREAKVSPVTQSPKSWAEKDSILPAFNPPVIKRVDNKVHPLLEALTPPVVTQPVRGQGAQTEVARRSTEPDVLEMLFIFCGQHCPIL